MKKLILFLALLFLPFSVWAMPATYGVDITEADGSPSIGAYKIVFPNGTLTCASGICTYAPSATSATFTDFYLSGPDVTHGMTSIAATSDYLAAFQIGSSGGAEIYGMTEADQAGALRLTGIIGATNPTDLNPAVIFRGGKKNGTGWQALGAAESAFAFYNYTTPIGWVYGNGEWILPAIENTPIGQSIARAGNFTTVAIGATLRFRGAYTVATIPVDPAEKDIIVVTDGAAACDQVTGSGTSASMFRYSGVAWVCVGDGGTAAWATLTGKPATPASDSLLAHKPDGTLANVTSFDLALTTGKIWQGVANLAAEKTLAEAGIAPVTISRTEFLPVAWMIDGAAAPAALATVDLGTRQIKGRAFQGDTADQDLEMFWQAPIDIIDGGAAAGFQVKWRPIYIITSATAPAAGESVAFALQACSSGNGDTGDCTVGTASIHADADLDAHVQFDIVYGAYTEITVTDGAAAEGWFMKLYRDQDNAQDDYAQPVSLVGIEVKYKATLADGY